jgi:hypothetical protein
MSCIRTDLPDKLSLHSCLVRLVLQKQLHAVRPGLQHGRMSFEVVRTLLHKVWGKSSPRADFLGHHIPSLVN